MVAYRHGCEDVDAPGKVVPDNMDELFTNENSPGTQRTMEAMLTMKKLDIAALRRAHDGAE